MTSRSRPTNGRPWALSQPGGSLFPEFQFVPVPPFVPPPRPVTAPPAPKPRPPEHPIPEALSNQLRNHRR